MGKEQPPCLAGSISRYGKSKKKLEQALTHGECQQADDVEVTIHQAEEELETAFAKLLYSTPHDLPEALRKSRLLITDVLSEADLTQYQTLALQCIIDDMTDLLGKFGNRSN